MGKKQSTKDRGYLTAKEWATEWGGAKNRAAGGAPFRCLPFSCCALAFTPFEDPVCTADGAVFDIVNIVPYIQRFHRHPVTGALCRPAPRRCPPLVAHSPAARCPAAVRRCWCSARRRRPPPHPTACLCSPACAGVRLQTVSQP